jgi:hypothetical protein
VFHAYFCVQQFWHHFQWCHGVDLVATSQNAVVEHRRSLVCLGSADALIDISTVAVAGTNAVSSKLL